MNRSDSKKQKESLTILVIPHSAAATRKISISRTAVFLAGLFTAVFFCSLIFLGVQYYLSQNERQVMREMKNENESMQSELTELSNELLQIQAQTQDLGNKQESIKKMMGVSSGGNKTSPTPSRSGMSLGGRSSGSRATALLARARALGITLNLQQTETNRLLSQAKKRAQALRAMPNRWPLYGGITSDFGLRPSPFNRRRTEYHDGIDIKAHSGAEVRAAGEGVVVYADWESGFGRLVRINHGNGYETYYAHNSKLLVKKGDRIQKGQVISLVGSSGRSTGPHLHFKVLKNGQEVDPMRVLP
ncbi:MAG: peptidoglycan DD-metalloendopeptidase family protein [Solirubrobacterales bacterium]